MTSAMFGRVRAVVWHATEKAGTVIIADVLECMCVCNVRGYICVTETGVRRELQRNRIRGQIWIGNTSTKHAGKGGVMLCCLLSYMCIIQAKYRCHGCCWLAAAILLCVCGFDSCACVCRLCRKQRTHTTTKRVSHGGGDRLHDRRLFLGQEFNGFLLHVVGVQVIRIEICHNKKQVIRYRSPQKNGQMNTYDCAAPCGAPSARRTRLSA